jgi:uncharacterized sulfatase
MAGAAISRLGWGADRSPKPNIILVLMDDMGWGQFGPNSDMFDVSQFNPVVVERAGGLRPEAALAAAKSAAPNFSRLSAEGTRFSDAYVTSALCAPSRCGIMTARYPQRFGGYVNRDIETGGIPVDYVLPVQMLQKSGYATAAIGKWHISKAKGGMERGAGQHPLERGFDYFFGFNKFGTDYYDSNILYRNYEKAQAKGYLTEQFTDEAIGFTRRSKDRPFFLYLPYNAVHGPLDKPAPDKYLKRFDTGVKKADNFYAYLNAADDGVGRILADLKQQGRLDNTLVFLLSDNGASGGSPMPTNGPFLGFKGQVWQGGVRVPMIMWGPGLVPAGKIHRDPVISMDIMATALAAAGARMPAGYDLDGQNLLPALNGQRKQPLHDRLCWAGQLAQQWNLGPKDELTAPPAWAIRKDNWMLHYWSSLQRFELYDLATDRGERQDVGDRHPDTVRELRAEYKQWFKGTRKPMMLGEEYWNLLNPDNAKTKAS